MKISIIIATLNNQDTIDKNLSSINFQTYKNFEIIVIDGGSKDKTLDILKKYNFLNIKFKKQKSKGVYGAFNEGIKLSTGEIIVILNADDFFNHEECLNIIFNEFNKDKNIDLLMSNVKIISKKNIVKRIYKSNNFKNYMFYFGHMPPHTGIFVKKKIYENYGYFIENFNNAGDFEFLLRVLYKKKIKFKKLDDYLVTMFSGGKSNKSIKSFFVNTLEIKKALRLNGFISSYIFIMIRFIIKIFQFNLK